MEEKHETPDEMLAREEMPQVQDQEVALNQPATVRGESEQEVKRKLVEDVFLYLLPALKETYSYEIALLGYKSGSLTEEEELRNQANLLNAIVGISANSQADQSEPIKSSQERVRQEETERVKEELKCIILSRLCENEVLEYRIEPFGLTVKEVKRDGHSLFRAVEDQLALHSQGSSQYGYQELRGLAVTYMREHVLSYLSCFVPVDDDLARSDITVFEKFERYCDKMESSAMSGGLDELDALAHCLKKHIILFCGFFPKMEMGTEYKSSEASIYISCHRVLNQLEDHYNSLIPCLKRKGIPQMYFNECVFRQPATISSKSKSEKEVEKKLLEDMFLYLLPALKETYPGEIALLGYKSGSLTEDEEWRNRTTLLNAIVGFSVNSQADRSQPIESGQERVRQEETKRVKEELKYILLSRLSENEVLENGIEPFGLIVKEIKRDGHSLFRAVEDQLALHGSSNYGYQELRRLAVTYMREHALSYLSCFVPVDDDLARSDITMFEKFERYCEKMESSAVSGGLDELDALAHCLKKHIVLFCGFFPKMEMGTEYKSSEASIFISCHRVLNQLEDHYNSLVPK